MQRLKEYAKKALYPPVWCLAVLAAVSGIGLYFVFTTGADAKPNPAVYILYTLSAYTLLILCLRAARLIQKAFLSWNALPFSEDTGTICVFVPRWCFMARWRSMYFTAFTRRAPAFCCTRFGAAHWPVTTSF